MKTKQVSVQHLRPGDVLVNEALGTLWLRVETVQQTRNRHYLRIDGTPLEPGLVPGSTRHREASWTSRHRLDTVTVVE